MSAPGDADLMLRAEVAALFRVTRQTITRWTAAGKLRPAKTPGGDPRYLAGEVRALIAGQRLTERQRNALLEQALQQAKRKRRQA